MGELAEYSERELKRLLDLVTVPEFQEEFADNGYAYEQLIKMTKTLNVIYEGKVRRREEIEKIVNAKIQMSLEQFETTIKKLEDTLSEVVDKQEEAEAHENKNVKDSTPQAMPSEENLRWMKK